MTKYSQSEAVFKHDHINLLFAIDASFVVRYGEETFAKQNINGMDEKRHVDVNDSFYSDTLHLLHVNISCAPVELCVVVADPGSPRRDAQTNNLGNFLLKTT